MKELSHQDYIHRHASTKKESKVKMRTCKI